MAAVTILFTQEPPRIPASECATLAVRIELDTRGAGRCNAGSELAGKPRVARRPVNPMHLVDTTLFYSPTSGGIRRYLNAKHAWLQANTTWEHTMVVPGPEDRVDRGDVCTLG